MDSSSRTKNTSEIQDKQYRLTINKVISNFGVLLVYMAKLIDLYNEEYSSINKQSNDIREKALQLQIKINNLLIKKSDKAPSTISLTDLLKADAEESKPYHGMEEKLLLRASRNFSLLTEINQILAKANYLRNESSLNIDHMCQVLGLSQIAFLGESDKEIPSLCLEVKQYSETISYNFQNLKIELDHSQSTIRNTVDILKTFLESEQRMVSQRSSEAINWIVIVFAGLGLADALGNFVIFWLEGGSGYKAIFWFSIIMLMLIVTIGVLYVWYFRRPNYLKKIG